VTSLLLLLLLLLLAVLVRSPHYALPTSNMHFPSVRI